jgi:hypothetical protein
MATPVSSGAPAIVAFPVVASTPGSGIALPTAAAEESSVERGSGLALHGTVSLTGTINEAFVIGDDGFVGLGRYAGVQAGQQVVVRDEAGAIVAITQLEATGSDVVCNWTFEVEAPESNFYAVSIPMLGEHVFTSDEVVNSNGQIELVLP